MIKVSKARMETDQQYTVFSDPTAAASIVALDGVGPGQSSAKSVYTGLVNLGNTVIVWWTQAHLGTESNEAAEERAKCPARSFGANEKTWQEDIFRRCQAHCYGGIPVQ